MTNVKLTFTAKFVHWYIIFYCNLLIFIQIELLKQETEQSILTQEWTQMKMTGQNILTQELNQMKVNLNQSEDRILNAITSNTKSLQESFTKMQSSNLEARKMILFPSG